MRVFKLALLGGSARVGWLSSCVPSTLAVPLPQGSRMLLPDSMRSWIVRPKVGEQLARNSSLVRIGPCRLSSLMKLISLHFVEGALPLP